MHFLPWWALVACLPASAVAAYLLLVRTQEGDSRWARFPLAVALAPVVLAGAAVAALVLSTLLSAVLDEQPAAPTDPSEPAARTERTGAEATTEGTGLRTTSEEPTAPAMGSPSASPGASPSASASASASP